MGRDMCGVAVGGRVERLIGGGGGGLRKYEVGGVVCAGGDNWREKSLLYLNCDSSFVNLQS